MAAVGSSAAAPVDRGRVNAESAGGEASADRRNADGRGAVGKAKVRRAVPDRATAEPDEPAVTVSRAEPLPFPDAGEPGGPPPTSKNNAGTDPSGKIAAPNPDVRPSRLGRRRRVLLPLAAGLLAATVAATTYLVVDRRSGRDDVGRWGGTAAEAAPFAVSSEPTPDPFGTTAPTLTGAPTRLKVKAIGVDTKLETLRLGDDGELTPPKDFDKAGWYADGTRPGDVGPAVIAGHVDSKRGPAVFYRLRELEAGDRIDVVRGGRTVRFTVTSTAWYPKKKFPTDRVYGPTPDRQLRLITCGGVYDRSLRSYRDNLVVYAVAG
jgi:hypothetical protein